MTEPSHLDDALRMAVQGMRIFPCSVRFDPATSKWSKTPMVPKNLVVATSDLEQIRRWDAELGHPRWGVVADTFVLMDIDGDEAYSIATELGLPATPEVATLRPGGRHRFYRPFTGAWSGAGVRPGIDIRGGGTGFALLHHPWTVADMGEAPEWFRVRPKAIAGSAPQYDWTTGNFHNSMVRFAAHFAGLGWGVDRIQVAAQEACGEELDVDSVRCITTAIEKFAPRSSPTLDRNSRGARAPDGGFDLTEFGNADRLLEAYGGSLRYDVAAQVWLTWDGARWARDDVGVARRFTEAVITAIGNEADQARVEAEGL
ncbi:MAG: bifunctional DNA primase/polymerase, partial [Thermoplasmata archaeon]|nr:bifunctional DNA primase/polymerase [Thermoplasmata archaeon]